MTDKALEVAHNPSAPQDERSEALREAQQVAMPSSVTDMLPLVEFIARQREEEDFNKALLKPNVIPFPSQAVQQRKSGMQSVWLDERQVQMLGDYYEKPSAFSFDMMRQMVDQTPVLSAVVFTRIRQIKRFCRVVEGGKGPGFEIRLKNQNSTSLRKDEQQSIELLQHFMTNCGWESNPRQRMRLKRDNFSNFMAKLVRDSLILDSSPIETEFKRDRSLGLDGFYAVDGATIRLCNEEGYQGDDEIFALQVVQGNLRAAYTYDDLVYVPRNPRTDVLTGGYGMSETELLVKVVTGFLNAMTYNMKYFDSNAIPKGMLHLTGDYSNDDINSFKRYWNAMVRGINNQWTLPVMVSKNQESKAAFEKFGVDVNEIMFAKWMTFLTSIICAIYGIAPDEINFESFTAGTSSLSGSDTEEKLINSKDKGLRPLLAHFEDLFSDYIISEFSDKYVFRWTGLDEKDEKQLWEEEKSLRTVNECRKARNWEELKEDWANAPLNQTVMQAYMAGKAAEQQAQAAAGGEPDDGSVPEPGDQEQETPTDPEFQKLLDEGAQRQSAEDDGSEEDDLAKSFGMPVFKVEP